MVKTALMSGYDDMCLTVTRDYGLGCLLDAGEAAFRTCDPHSKIWRGRDPPGIDAYGFRLQYVRLIDTYIKGVDNTNFRRLTFTKRKTLRHTAKN